MVTTAINPIVDLYVTKAVNHTGAFFGNTIVYTINYGNSGVNIATGVTLSDIIPAGLT
jgi:uncharacterized repeat protein (TIGR01451 family)